MILTGILVSWPGKAWAKRVFPNIPDEEAILKLADAIFDASRVSVDDPIKAWMNIMNH